MPFLMIRNDITKVTADAIVNPANRNLLQGSGTSRAIYQAAGEQELTAACEAIGHCEPGRAVCTPAFGLPAKYIFHAVCPAWQGGSTSCYSAARQMLFVAMLFLNARSCSTKIIVGENSLIRFSICIRE